ncbi:MAG TPA: hypothetical protein VF407_14365 [Polyangiaceae bacterium]
MAKKKKVEKRRKEQRFFPQSNANPWIVRVIGALGAIALGAGAYEQFLATAPEPWKYTPYVLAAGALFFALSIWFGTSGDPVLRVGDAGVGLDRGNVERIAWNAVTEVGFDPKMRAVFVNGKDENGKKKRIDAKLASQPQAAAWIAKEAKDRIPKLVDLKSAGAEDIPEARTGMAGDTIALEPLQVVGKKCANSDKLIAFEPDARVCPRCERIYYKNNVPKKCACGAHLSDLRNAKSLENADDEEDEDDVEESAPVSEPPPVSSKKEAEEEEESA